MVCICTAVTYQSKDHYFGRNLDYEFSYEESVTITPRKFPLSYRYMEENRQHYAMIGMAYVKDGYPLYYDATNENGLSIAGLNFPGNAVYQPAEAGKKMLAPYELIPWLLGNCSSVAEAKTALEEVTLVAVPFSKELSLTPLHWMIADNNEAIVVEPMKDGLKIYSNPVGVLTNNPPFPMQLFQLNQYPFLTNGEPENTFCDEVGS